MPERDRVLSLSAVRRYYDWLGRRLDSQGFYENPALDALVAHANFEDADSVFEFGCGTGKFASRLLENHLPDSATYFGYDVSSVMVDLAKRRIALHGDRVRVALSDGSVRFPLRDQSVDRIVSSYVLDLLSESDIRQFFAEAHRSLTTGGKVCLASLTEGVAPLSRIVSSLWRAAFRLSPKMVGGCRPIGFDAFIDPRQWRIAYRAVLAPFGVPSEVVVLDVLDERGAAVGGRPSEDAPSVR